MGFGLFYFRSFVCKWTFKAQPGLQLLLQLRGATIEDGETIEVIDTNSECSIGMELGTYLNGKIKTLRLMELNVIKMEKTHWSS